MNIIFGTESVTPLRERYTVLELDTFVLHPTEEIVTAYCLVESIPVPEMFEIQRFKDLHSNLVTEYKKKNWEYCEDVIGHLTGKWGGEVDSFYSELHQRIQKLKQTELPQDWTGYLDRTVEVV